jgi:hypothetical protein
MVGVRGIELGDEPRRASTIIIKATTLAIPNGIGNSAILGQQ